MNDNYNATAVGMNSAILRYKGAPAVEPITSKSPVIQLGERQLHPLTNAQAPGKPIPGGAGQPHQALASK